MNRLIPLATAALLALATARVPAATATQSLTSQQSEELVSTYAHLTADFYKTVDKQAALAGARTAIIAYVEKQGHVEHPALPPIKAGSDDEQNASALEHEVSDAIGLYASKLKPVDSLSGATQITYVAIEGVLHSVNDKYTVFLSPKEYAALNEGLDGTSFGGVGISYSLDDKTKNLIVENVILDGPSDEAGLLSEDQIVAIDGKPVTTILAGATTTELQQKRVTDALRGEPGTKVQLTILRDGKTLPPVEITRAEIHQPSVMSKMLPGNVGYLELSVFGATTAQELDTALKRLDSEGAKAYVLDLRYNGGGYLNAAVDVSSKFISSGPIVSVQSRAGTDTEYDAENDAVAPRPLAVLVNKYTASASEITAGAIQDSGVGTLIGTGTYGKGVVQTIFPMRDGSAVKITTARYFTPKGRDINTVGIAPDIVSTIPKDAAGQDQKIRLGDLKQDPQLVAALNYLDGRLAQQAPPVPGTPNQ
jgi:carboxyl-terminal processing protease